MARRLRLDFPGAKHHVMNRGARRAPVFGRPEARAAFLDLLPLLGAQYGLIIHAYAVMATHYHLLVTSPDIGLATPMKWLDQVFTQRMNVRAGWDGPVFRGRYHDVLVTEPEHWRHLAAYVHLNPVEHGGPERMFDPEWTSHAAFAGSVAVPAWLHPDELLDAHGGREPYLDYVDGIRQGVREAPEGFDALAFRGERTVVAPPRCNEAGPAELLARVERVTGRPIVREAYSRDPILAIAAWWLRTRGITLAESSRLLGLSPASLSRRISRLLARAEGDPKLAGWMAAIAGRDPRVEVHEAA